MLDVPGLPVRSDEERPMSTCIVRCPECQTPGRVIGCVRFACRQCGRVAITRDHVVCSMPAAGGYWIYPAVSADRQQKGAP